MLWIYSVLRGFRCFDEVSRFFDSIVLRIIFDSLTNNNNIDLIRIKSINYE